METFGTDSFVFTPSHEGIDPARFENPDPGSLDGLGIPGTDLMDAFMEEFGSGGMFPGSDSPFDPQGGFGSMDMPGEGSDTGEQGGTMPDLSGVDGSMVGASGDDALDNRFGKGNWTRDSDGNVIVKEDGNTYTFGKGLVKHIENGTEPEDGIWIKTGENSYSLFSPTEVAKDAQRRLDEKDKKDEGGKKEDAPKDDGGAKMDDPTKVDEGTEFSIEAAQKVVSGLLGGSDPLTRVIEGDGGTGTTMTDEEAFGLVQGLNDPISLYDPDSMEQAPVAPEDVIPESDPLINPGNPLDDMFG